MTNSTFDICPFTLKSLASTKLEDVAIIYASNPLKANYDDGAPSQEEVQCGHSCSLSFSLISYLHDSSGTKQCPVCQESPANVVCDIISSAFLINHDGASINNNNGRVISFRYGNISYYLWVHSTESIQSSSYYSKRAFSGRKRTNALHRIGDVLGIELKNIRVLYKGKILHPNTESESLDDISEQLLDISTADILHKRKKPSLVVMGCRKTKTIEKKQSTANILCTIASVLNPLFLLNLMTHGLCWTFQTTKSVFGGLYLFVNSLLYPPQQTQ